MENSWKSLQRRSLVLKISSQYHKLLVDRTRCLHQVSCFQWKKYFREDIFHRNFSVYILNEFFNKVGKYCVCGFHAVEYRSGVSRWSSNEVWYIEMSEKSRWKIVGFSEAIGAISFFRLLNWMKNSQFSFLNLMVSINVKIDMDRWIFSY